MWTTKPDIFDFVVNQIALPKINLLREMYLYTAQLMCFMQGVHIIPFLIPNRIGPGVENTFRGMKVHFICHCEP